MARQAPFVHTKRTEVQWAPLSAYRIFQFPTTDHHFYKQRSEQKIIMCTNCAWVFKTKGIFAIDPIVQRSDPNIHVDHWYEPCISFKGNQAPFLAIAFRPISILFLFWRSEKQVKALGMEEGKRLWC